MAYNNDNLAVAIHDTDNIITEENIEECVVDYWTQRVKDFSDVREHELNSDMGKEWLEEIISNISMYTAYDKKSGMSSGTDVTENSRIKVLDVGTGVGYFAILLNRCGMDVTGIDLTPDMITRAKELADKYGADVTYEVMDAMELSYADETFDVKVLPAWRPDKAMNIEKPDFLEYVQKLACVSGIKVDSVKSLLAAIDNRMEFFDSMKCCVSDHGLNYVVYQPASEEAVEAIFQKKVNGEKLTQLEIDQYKTAFMIHVGREYHRRGWLIADRDMQSLMFT